MVQFVPSGRQAVLMKSAPIRDVVLSRVPPQHDVAQPGQPLAEAATHPADAVGAIYV